MKLYSLLTLLTLVSPLGATVQIASFTSSVTSPQPLGTPIVFTATATDSDSGPVAFEFSVAYESGPAKIIRNFNIGVKSGSTWTSQPFSWSNISGEGAYSIIVNVANFKTGTNAHQTLPFTLNPIVTGGNITVVPTSNSLVALAGVPPCPAGSNVYVYFYDATHSAIQTPLAPCTGTLTNNFYLGGMHANDTYTVGYAIQTGSTYTNGSSTASFTSGALPAGVLFPTETVIQPAASTADTADRIVLHSFTVTAPGQVKNYQPLATDLSGNAVWYYDGGPNDFALLTRPQPGGQFLLIESGPYWGNGSLQEAQTVRLIDLTGNVLAESNAGLMSHQLLQMGATGLQLCSNIPLPAAVGSECMAGFTHELIALPSGGFAVLASIERIFPPGTQGDTTGLNVDIVGNGIVVLNKDLNVIWYWDAFEHDGGGTQLDINRAAILGETCSPSSGGSRCVPLFLAGTPGVTTVANDWLHGNALQYRESDGDIVFSSRHQDWVMKIDFKNATGTGDLIWRMGLDGDFTFNNINNDPYPWFSGQHDAAFETNGVFDLFDNGDTRIAQMGGNSRGMALNVDETNLIVTPVLSQDLGYYGLALGSAQLLSNGNYHFQPGVVAPTYYSYSMELLPTPGTTSASTVYNLMSEFGSYRSFRMPDMYTPPNR